jgi:hypothetical protein
MSSSATSAAATDSNASSAMGETQEVALRTLLVAVAAAQSKSPYSLEEAASIWKAMSVFVRPAGGNSTSNIVMSAQSLFQGAESEKK